MRTIGLGVALGSFDLSSFWEFITYLLIIYIEFKTIPLRESHLQLNIL